MQYTTRSNCGPSLFTSTVRKFFVITEVKYGYNYTIQNGGAAGILNLGNLNVRDIILSTEAIQNTRFIINSAEQIQTTPSVCDETADTNRPGYTV